MTLCPVVVYKCWRVGARQLVSSPLYPGVYLTGGSGVEGAATRLNYRVSHPLSPHNEGAGHHYPP